MLKIQERIFSPNYSKRHDSIYRGYCMWYVHFALIDCQYKNIYGFRLFFRIEKNERIYYRTLCLIYWFIKYYLVFVNNKILQWMLLHCISVDRLIIDLLYRSHCPIKHFAVVVAFTTVIKKSIRYTHFKYKFMARICLVCACAYACKNLKNTRLYTIPSAFIWLEEHIKIQHIGWDVWLLTTNR